MTAPTGRARGRTPLPAEAARRTPMSLRVTPAEHALLAAWGAAEGRPVAELVREAAIAWARVRLAVDAGEVAR